MRLIGWYSVSRLSFRDQECLIDTPRPHELHHGLEAVPLNFLAWQKTRERHAATQDDARLQTSQVPLLPAPSHPALAHGRCLACCRLDSHAERWPAKARPRSKHVNTLQARLRGRGVASLQQPVLKHASHERCELCSSFYRACQDT